MRASITSGMGRAVRRFAILGLGLAAAAVMAASCAPRGDAPPVASAQADENNYLIGPGDTLQIFVWRNPDLSTSVPVRPTRSRRVIRHVWTGGNTFTTARA